MLESLARAKVSATERLIAAVHTGDTEAANKAVSAGADVSANNHEALRWGACYGHTDTVKLLLEHRANPSANNHEALRLAARHGHTDTVKLLLEHGADVSACNNDALRWASENGHTDIVKLLLEHGADLSANTHEALRQAAQNGHTDIVKLFLEHGADLSAYNHAALRWAARSGHTDTVTLLLGHRADVSADNHYALRWAAYYGHTETVKLLLEHGADVSANNHEALCWAAEGGHTDTVKLLLEYGADLSASKHEARPWAARSRSTVTVQFLKLAEEILSQTNDRKTCKRFFDDHAVAYPAALKSEVFSKSPDCNLPNLTGVLLHTAYAAAILGEGKEGITRETFRALAADDIQRVEATTGLSYRKYGQHLRARGRGLTDFKDVITEVAETLTYPKLAEGEDSARMARARVEALSLPAAARNAWEQAKRLLVSGQGVTFSQKLGLTDEAKRRMQEKISQADRIAGFPVSEREEYQAKILEHYSARMVIQRGSSKQQVPLIAAPKRVALSNEAAANAGGALQC